MFFLYPQVLTILSMTDWWRTSCNAALPEEQKRVGEKREGPDTDEAETKEA